MKKHLFSFLTVLALSLALFPAAVSAADGYAVDDVTIEGASVGVRVTAETNCALFVGLYDENGKMLEVRTETVTGKAEGQSVSVQFNHEIVNGVYAKAFLVNPDTCAPLCEGVDSKFHAEEYALIERIAIETTVNHVTTKTSSMLGVAGTTVMTMPENSETLQLAYNQCKDAVGNSTWDAQAQLRFSNGTRRTVTLDDSKNYRTSAASDASIRVNDATYSIEQEQDGIWNVLGSIGSIGIVRGTPGHDGNWIAEPFTAGHIVRISSNDDGYHLQSVNAARVYYVYDFTFDGNRISSNGKPLTFGNTTIYADSITRFVIEDMAQGTYKSYIGVENAPTVNLPTGSHIGDNPIAYIYHENGLAKLIFVTNAWNVIYPDN